MTSLSSPAEAKLLVDRLLHLPARQFRGNPRISDCAVITARRQWEPFDLEADRFQGTNIAADRPETVKEDQCPVRSVVEKSRRSGADREMGQILTVALRTANLNTGILSGAKSPSAIPTA